MLSNSYAFAYFFFGGDLFKGEFTEDQNLVNQNLFEDSQEQLANEVGGRMYCVNACAEDRCPDPSRCRSQQPTASQSSWPVHSCPLTLHMGHCLPSCAG